MTTAAAQPVNPYLFIVGCLRSGTTMLRHLVDAHREIAVVNETQWLPRWFGLRKYRKSGAVTPQGEVTPKLVAELLGFERFSRLRVQPADVEALVDNGGHLSYADFVSAVFSLHGRAEGKPIVGEKSPGYARCVPTLHLLWPRARVVHLIRDGRDVWLSMASWRQDKVARTVGRFVTWQDDPVTTTALWWEWHVRLARQAGATLESDLYHEIRYETLVSETSRECADLCSFLAVRYDPEMLRFHERHVVEGERPRRGPAVPVTPGLRDWRSQMRGDHLERFEAAVGDLLDELNYERITQRAPRREDAARRVRRAFVEDARSRRRPLPEGWV